MADYVSVANLALGKIGEAHRLTDPADATHPARMIAGPWAMVRRAVLRKGKFNFAISRDELAAQSPTDPGYRSPYPFANRFPLPSDTLRLIEVLGPPEVVETYKYENKAVLADSAGPVWVRRVFDVTAIGDWDELFVETFAARLAYEIADPLSGDRARKADCWAEYLQNTRDGAGVDAKEDPPEAPYDSSWVTARFGGSVGGPPNV